MPQVFFIYLSLKHKIPRTCGILWPVYFIQLSGLFKVALILNLQIFLVYQNIFLP